jgi:hypothetical protein
VLDAINLALRYRPDNDGHVSPAVQPIDPRRRRLSIKLRRGLLPNQAMCKNAGGIPVQPPAVKNRITNPFRAFQVRRSAFITCRYVKDPVRPDLACQLLDNRDGSIESRVLK